MTTSVSSGAKANCRLAGAVKKRMSDAFWFKRTNDVSVAFTRPSLLISYKLLIAAELIPVDWFCRTADVSLALVRTVTGGPERFPTLKSPTALPK